MTIAFSNAWRTGAGVDIGVGFGGQTEIVFTGFYHRFSLDVGVEGESGGNYVVLEGGPFTVFGARMGFKYNAPSSGNIGLYLYAGAGFYRREVEAVTHSLGIFRDSESSTDLGLTTGVGIAVSVSARMLFLLEPQFTYILTDDADDLTFFPLRLGAAIRN